MTKAELIDSLCDYHDDDLVVVEVHDPTGSKDLYDFYVDAVEMGVHRGKYPAFDKRKHELRISVVNHHENITQ